MTLLMKIPLVVYSDQPPSHQITCITICKNGVIVTGSIEGQLVFWTITDDKNELKILAKSMVIAHSSSVESLVDVSNEKLEIKSGVISLADNQELCLWNSETCCCLSNIFLHGRFHTLKALPCRYSKMMRDCLLACFGYQNIILIIDPFSLQTIFILKQSNLKSSIGTIRSISFASSDEKNNDDILLAVTHDNSLITWSLSCNFGALKDGDHIETIGICKNLPGEINDPCIRIVCVEPKLAYYILICSRQNIFLLKNVSCMKFITKISTDNFNIINVLFLSHASFVVYFENNSPQLYLIDNDTIIMATRLLIDPNAISQPIVECLCASSKSSYLHSQYLFGATSNGRLVAWKANEEENTGSTNDAIYACVSASLADAWKIYKPHGIANNLAQLLSLQEVIITCSLQLHEYGFMIFGLKSGLIIIASTIELLTNRLLEDSKLNKVSCVLLKGHIGSVTCLCHPFEGCNNHNPCHLLSGGIDFSIRLWDITAGTQLKVYYPHGGFIQEIFVLSGEMINYSNLTVISVAGDYSVALINLSYEKEILTTNCHTSPVYSVKWRIKEDLLLVYCTDGTLFIWQITTGNLERCVTGKNAIEIFEARGEDEFDIIAIDQLQSKKTSHLIVSIDSNDIPKNSHNSFIRDIKTKRGFMSSHTHNAHILSSKKKVFQKVLRKISVKHKQDRNTRVNKDVQDQNINKISPPVSLSNVQSASSTNVTSHPSHHSSACNLAIVQQPVPPAPKNKEETLHSTISSIIPPFDVISIRTGHHDSDFHIFLVDFDILISHLLCEEELINFKNSLFKANTEPQKISPFTSSSLNIYSCQSMCSMAQAHQSLSLIILTLGLCPTSDSKTYKKYCYSIQNYHSYLLLATAKFLISCLRPWGLDSQLDDICKNSLDLSSPISPVSFGFMAHNKLQLSMPGWSPNTSSSQSTSILELNYNNHWQMSSVMTAQHLVALASLTNAVLHLYTLDSWKEPVVPPHHNQQKDKFSQAHKIVSYDPISGRQFITTSVPNLYHHKQAEVYHSKKIGWKMAYHQHSCMISLAMKENIYYQQPFIHELICYWLDSFDEVRESCYCILMQELNQMAKPSRQSLVRSWCIYLPNYEEVENTQIEQLLILPFDDNIESGGFYGFWPSNKRYRRTIAIFLVSFIVSEFSREYDPLNAVANKIRSPTLTAGVMIVLASIMAKTIKSTICLKKYALYPMRKAFLFFLGRSFDVWQPHLNLSQLIMALLDTNATLDYYLQFLESNSRHKTYQYTMCFDMLLTHRNCLRDIMLSNPETVISMLNKEISRYTSTNSYVSIGQSALAAAVAYSHIRQHPNPLSSYPSMLQLARNEIIRILDIMSKKMPDKFSELIIDIVDLILACSAHKIIKKDSNFVKTFPFLKQFNMVDYCEHTRRLAVGTTTGQFGMFDVRNLRCSLIQSSNGPITCLKFSSDGRYMVTFCLQEMKICVWNTQVS
ncbi:hypothetical protein HZS_7836, partial [Henneguya salminicola]